MSREPESRHNVVEARELEVIEERPVGAEVRKMKTHRGDTITRKQFLFIEYLFNPELKFDAERAAILAGYKSKNISDQAKKLMDNTIISAEIMYRLRLKREAEDHTIHEIKRSLWLEGNDKDNGTGASRVAALANLLRAEGGFEKGQAEKVPVAINMNFGFDDEEEEDDAGGEGERRLQS